MMYRKLMAIVLALAVLTPLLAGGRSEKPTAGTADGLSGELVILNWLSGAEAKAMREVQEAFMTANPGVRIRDVNVGAGGDERVNIRAALLSGDRFDLIVNTWPSFEKELAEAGLLRPLDEAWNRFNWHTTLNESWRQMSTIEGKLYGVYFIASNRSGVWYRRDTLAAAGIQGEPATWQDLIAASRSLKSAGYTPFSVGASVWAHTEYFENIYLKVAGVNNARRLVNREIPWTDASVRNTLTRWAELLEQGFFPAPQQMFAIDWDGAIDAVFDQRTTGFNLMGSWVNGRAISNFGLRPGKDFSFFQFPVIDPAYANTMSIDGKNLIAPVSSPNPAAAEAFLDFLIGNTGANLIARNGISTPSSLVDTSLFDVNTAKYVPMLSERKVFFVMDDLLPAELSAEFRTQLQRFLASPTSSQITAFMNAMEAKARNLY